MSMTIDVPDGFEGLGESMRALLSDIALGVKTARFGRTPDYSKVEENVAERAAEIERQTGARPVRAFREYAAKTAPARLAAEHASRHRGSSPARTQRAPVGQASTAAASHGSPAGRCGRQYPPA